MAFNGVTIHAAIQKYMRSIRAEGPYLPSNVDFVAANNGIKDGAEGVRKVAFDASYMVLGLGDVYLGAPCAVPLDPRWPLFPPSLRLLFCCKSIMPAKAAPNFVLKSQTV